MPKLLAAFPFRIRIVPVTPIAAAFYAVVGIQQQTSGLEGTLKKVALVTKRKLLKCLPKQFLSGHYSCRTSSYNPGRERRATNSAGHWKERKPTTHPMQSRRRFRSSCKSAGTQGNLNAASEYLVDQVRFHDPAFPNLNAGVQNIKNHIEQCRRAFPDLKFTIDDTIAERNEVVLRWNFRGTHKGKFLGMQPTNRQVNLGGPSIYRLEGSKIAEPYANWNLASIRQQIGVIELPNEARASANNVETHETKLHA